MALLPPPPPPPIHTEAEDDKEINNDHLSPPPQEKCFVTIVKHHLDVDLWIIHVRNDKKHRLALDKPVVGLSIEWRPTDGYDDDPTAILRLSVGPRCLVFRIFPGRRRFPVFLKWFLNDPEVTFCGVGIEGDAKKLYDNHGLKVATTVDLRDLYGECYGEEEEEGGRASLKDMCRRVLGEEMKEIEEVILPSGWDFDVEESNDYRVQYGSAVDAFVSFKIAFALLRIKKNRLS